MGVSSPRFLPETKKKYINDPNSTPKTKKMIDQQSAISPTRHQSQQPLDRVDLKSCLYQEKGQQIHVSRGQSVAHDTADAANFHNNCTQRRE